MAEMSRRRVGEFVRGVFSLTNKGCQAFTCFYTSAEYCRRAVTIASNETVHRICQISLNAYGQAKED